MVISRDCEKKDRRRSVKNWPLGFVNNMRTWTYLLLPHLNWCMRTEREPYPFRSICQQKESASLSLSIYLSSRLHYHRRSCCVLQCWERHERRNQRGRPRVNSRLGFMEVASVKQDEFKSQPTSNPSSCSVSFCKTQNQRNPKKGQLWMVMLMIRCSPPIPGSIKQSFLFKEGCRLCQKKSWQLQGNPEFNVLLQNCLLPWSWKNDGKITRKGVRIGSFHYRGLQTAYLAHLQGVMMVAWSAHFLVFSSSNDF